MKKWVISAFLLGAFLVGSGFSVSIDQPLELPFEKLTELPILVNFEELNDADFNVLLEDQRDDAVLVLERWNWPYSCDDPFLDDIVIEYFGADATITDSPGNNQKYLVDCEIKNGDQKTLSFTLEDMNTMTNAKANFDIEKANNKGAVNGSTNRKAGIGVYSDGVIDSSGGKGKHRFLFVDGDSFNPFLINVVAAKDVNVSTVEDFARKLDEIV